MKDILVSLKEAGNKLFKDREYEKARERYLRAIRRALIEGNDEILFTIYGNVSLCCIHLELYKEAEKYARLAIQEQPDWEKAYYRAALAAKHQGRVDIADSMIEQGLQKCSTTECLLKLRSTLPKKRDLVLTSTKPVLTLLDDEVSDIKTIHSNMTSLNAMSSASMDIRSTTSLAPKVVSDVDRAGSAPGTFNPLSGTASSTDEANTIYKEVCEASKRGSLALVEMPNGAKQAVEQYKIVLGMVNRFKTSLKLSSSEINSLRYCYGLACSQLCTMESLISAVSELTILVEETETAMPVGFYLLGSIFKKLNRHPLAVDALKKCQDALHSGVVGEMYTYPGLQVMIPDLVTAHQGDLVTSVNKMLQECRFPPRPDAVCRFSDCSYSISKLDEGISHRPIYCSDPDFCGFIEVHCSERCHLNFHPSCWKALKDVEYGRVSDKDLLNLNCVTPDCVGYYSVIKTIDANAVIRHEVTSEPKKTGFKVRPVKCSKAHKRGVKQSRKHTNSGKHRQKVSNSATVEKTSATEQELASINEQPDDDVKKHCLNGIPDISEMAVLKRPDYQVGTNKNGKGLSISHQSSLHQSSASMAGKQKPDVYHVDDTELETLLSRFSHLRAEMPTHHYMDYDGFSLNERALIGESDKAPIVASTFQYIYDTLMTKGPCHMDASNLSSLTADLSPESWEIIGEFGSLEGFCANFPQFLVVGNILCVAEDAATAEMMVESACCGLDGKLLQSQVDKLASVDVASEDIECEISDQGGGGDMLPSSSEGIFSGQSKFRSCGINTDNTGNQKVDSNHDQMMNLAREKMTADNDILKNTVAKLQEQLKQTENQLLLLNEELVMSKDRNDQQVAQLRETNNQISELKSTSTQVLAETNRRLQLLVDRESELEQMASGWQSAYLDSAEETRSFQLAFLRALKVAAEDRFKQAIYLYTNAVNKSCPPDGSGRSVRKVIDEGIDSIKQVEEGLYAKVNVALNAISRCESVTGLLDLEIPSVVDIYYEAEIEAGDAFSDASLIALQRTGSVSIPQPLLELVAQAARLTDEAHGNASAAPNSMVGCDTAAPSGPASSISDSSLPTATSGTLASSNEGLRPPNQIVDASQSANVLQTEVDNTAEAFPTMSERVPSLAVANSEEVSASSSTPFNRLVGELSGLCPAAPLHLITKCLVEYRRMQGGSLGGISRQKMIHAVVELITSKASHGGPVRKQSADVRLCSICLENYPPSQAELASCGHWLHNLCLRRWKREQGINPTCPLCRQILVVEEFPALK